MAHLAQGNIERDVRRLRPFFTFPWIYVNEDGDIEIRPVGLDCSPLIVRHDGTLDFTGCGVVEFGGGAAWIGRRDGPHVGLFTRTTDAGLPSWTFEAVDTANRPFISAGSADERDGQWLYVGYADRPNIRLAYQENYGWRLIIDPETFGRLLDERELDINRLAAQLGLPLPGATAAGTGTLSGMLLVWQDGTLYGENADGTLTALIGAGRAAGHAHADADSGGQLDHAWLTGMTTGDPHTQYLLKAATVVGQVPYTLDGSTFTAQLPLTGPDGWLVGDDGLLLIVG